MESFWDCNFLVVDVETNGSNPQKDRIIDIGCTIINNGQVISEFTSLINPHQFIPKYIEKMTGITNELAFSAPGCEAVFKHFANLINGENTIFVAHNASFDWSFINATYQRLDWQIPKIPRLCTLKLARRLFPNSIKKGLDNLAKIFKVYIHNRHRALGDSNATAQILIELLDKAEFEHEIHTIDELIQFQNSRIRNYQLNKTAIKKFDKIIKTAPEEPGIYYFKDEKDDIIYIGKSKSLKERIKSYFTSNAQTSRKIIKLIKRIEKIEWECTDTELSALLLESKEIKKYKPEFNSMELKYRKLPFIRLTTNEEFPILEVVYSIENSSAEYYGPFRNKFLANEILEICRKKFKLRKCDKMPQPSLLNTPCIYNQIDKCIAPCALIVNKDDYEQELNRLRRFLSDNDNSLASLFEMQMNYLSENLMYESASILRDKLIDCQKIFNNHNDFPAPINEKNFILILPASKRAKTLEIFLIRSGKLIKQLVIGRKAPTKKLRELIHEIYFNGFTPPLFYSIEDTDDLRIINSWICRQSVSSHLIINGKTYEDVIAQIEFTIKNISFA